jgi:hypothetical protein
VFDPGGVSSPGRQVYSEEEYNELKDRVGPQLAQMNKLITMNPLMARVLLGTMGFIGKVKKLIGSGSKN